MKKLLLITGVLLLAACSPKSEKSEKPQDPPKGSVESVQTASPQKATIRKVRTVSVGEGILKSKRTVQVTLKASKESNVASTGSGKVEAILAPEGTAVSAGQVVIRLENINAQNQVNDAQLALQSARVNVQKAQNSQSENTSLLQAQVTAAQQTLALAQKRLKEGQELSKAGGIAALDLQSLQLNVTNAQNSLQNAEDNLNRVKRTPTEDLALLKLQVEQAQNRLTQAQKALNDTQVRAPFAGVVADVVVAQGEFLSTGIKAFQLVDATVLEGVFKLPPEQANQITPDSGLTILFAGQSYPVRLARRNPTTGTDRLVELVVRLPGSNIPVGSVASLQYSDVQGKGVIVPSGAVRTEDGASKVFSVQNGKVKANPVTLLAESDGKAVVQGIENIRQVVFPLASELGDGVAVEVVQ